MVRHVPRGCFFRLTASAEARVKCRATALETKSFEPLRTGGLVFIL